MFRNLGSCLYGRASSSANLQSNHEGEAEAEGKFRFKFRSRLRVEECWPGVNIGARVDPDWLLQNLVKINKAVARG